MEHTKKLEELNIESLKNLEEYMKTKGATTEEHHEKIVAAKDKWQLAWNEFLQTLVSLDKLEI